MYSQYKNSMIIKNEGQVRQILSGRWYQGEKGGHKERVKGREYGGNIMYLYLKMINRMMEGVNLTKIHCKHLCKCHSIPPVQQ
jgi:hypothetical protein